MNLEALAAAEGLEPTPKNLDTLSKRFGAEDARWAFTQWELRKRGRAKFARASEMLFDREGLEMATHEKIADFHASRFPEGVLVSDLTCGVGADLIALAKRGPVKGFEIRADRVALARHNLAVHDLMGEVNEGSFEVSDYFFADPARRSDGNRKSFDPSAYEPPLEDLASRAREAKGAVLKLSPLLPDRILFELGGQVAFISFDRECREALVMFGECQWTPEPVFAYQVESDEALFSADLIVHAEEPEFWLFEMDPAAIRAHMHASFQSLALLGDSNGYLTGDYVESPWLRAYRVLWHGKADVRATRKALGELGAATPVIKSRAPNVDPIALRNEFKLKGHRPLIVVVWPVGKSLRHTIVEAD